MDTLNLEKTMKEIVQIDSEAIDLEEKYNNLKMDYEKKLKKKIHALENQYMRDVKKKGKRYLKDMEHLMDDEEQKIRDVSIQECQDLDALFFHNKRQLVDQVFEKIIQNGDE